MSLKQALKFLCGGKSGNLRELLASEAVQAADVLLRQATRKAHGQVISRLPRLPFLTSLLPPPESVPLPVPIPVRGAFSNPGGFAGALSAPDTLLSQVNPVLVSSSELVETAAPKLSLEEELYALSLVDLARESGGADLASVINGDSINDPAAAARLLVQFVNGGSVSKLLPVPDGLKSALTSAASIVGGSRAGTTATGEHVFTDVSEGVDGLDSEERAVLDQFLGEVTVQLRERLIERLQVFV